MRAFIDCVLSYLGSFLPDLGWIAIALLIACILAGLAAAGLTAWSGPGAVAAGTAIFVLCLKAAGISVVGGLLIGIGDAIRVCRG